MHLCIFNAHQLLHVYYFYHIYSHAYLVMRFSAHGMEYNFGYKTMYYAMLFKHINLNFADYFSFVLLFY